MTGGCSSDWDCGLPEAFMQNLAAELIERKRTSFTAHGRPWKVRRMFWFVSTAGSICLFAVMITWGWPITRG